MIGDAAVYEKLIEECKALREEDEYNEQRNELKRDLENAERVACSLERLHEFTNLLHFDEETKAKREQAEKEGRSWKHHAEVVRKLIRRLERA
jgi:hypothetical protein